MKPDYGVDAPGKVIILSGAGVFFGMSASAMALVADMPFLGLLAALLGVVCVLLAVLMVVYAKRGKFVHRDRILALVAWRGDEHVLDIGTGLGLLLVGAAKRLTTGRAIGLDIWSAVDLSGNTRERALCNLSAEGVADRCELVEAFAQSLPLPDASVDVVLSNLCLHNIPTAAERDDACRHIARVLKPGGCAVISDFRHTAQYAASFRSAGLTANVTGAYWRDTSPPLRIVCAQKA